MGLETTITNGNGKGKSAFVTDEGALSVSDNRIPPLCTEVSIRPFRQYFTDNGMSTGCNDMRVVGTSTAPLDFYISASSDGDRYIDSISFVIADGAAALNEFGAIPALTNGVEIFYEDKNLGDVVIHDALKSNFDHLRLVGNGAHGIGATTSSYRASNVEGASEGYLMTLDFSAQFGMPWGIKLDKDSNLKLVIRIKDNTSAIDAYNAIAYGFDRIK